MYIESSIFYRYIYIFPTTFLPFLRFGVEDWFFLSYYLCLFQSWIDKWSLCHLLCLLSSFAPIILPFGVDAFILCFYRKRVMHHTYMWSWILRRCDSETFFSLLFQQFIAYFCSNIYMGLNFNTMGRNLGQLPIYCLSGYPLAMNLHILYVCSTRLSRI